MREAAGETVGEKRKTQSDAGVKKGLRVKAKVTVSSTSSPLKKKAWVKKTKSSKVAQQLPPKVVRSKSVISDSDDDDDSAVNSGLTSAIATGHWLIETTYQYPTRPCTDCTMFWCDCQTPFIHRSLICLPG